MRYGIKVSKTDSGEFHITSRDIPECDYVTKAATEAEAVETASEAMPAAMVLFYRKKRVAIPLPSPVEEGEAIAYVPTRIQAKILLWNYMIENRYRPNDLAKVLGVTPQRIQGFTDLAADRVSMDALDNALRAIGASFDLSITKN